MAKASKSSQITRRRWADCDIATNIQHGGWHTSSARSFSLREIGQSWLAAVCNVQFGKRNWVQDLHDKSSKDCAQTMM